MNIKWKLLTVLLSSAMLLAACNDSEDAGIQDEENAPPVTQGADGTVENNTPEEQEEPPVDDESQEPVLRKDELSLSYTHNDVQKEETGYLTASDEQNYSLYKLDGFELTGEEPNKDALYFVEDDSVFMRIETISDQEADYEIILHNMMQTLAAVSFDEEPTKITESNKLPTGEGIENAVGFEVHKEIGTITGYVFERNGMIVRLTVFDRNSANLTDAFLKMGETIDIK